MRSFPVLLVFVFVFAHAFTVSAADNYVPIELPHDVRIDLPRNWKVISRNQRITLDSSVQARTESIGVFNASSDLNFGANLYDEAGKTAALVNIRYYPDLETTQEDARSATDADVQYLDSVLRSSIAKNGQTFGYSILKWLGTSQRTLNGNVAFITEYERSPLNNNGNSRVRLVRFFNGRASFTITVSYRAGQEYLLRPICDRIISSIKA